MLAVADANLGRIGWKVRRRLSAMATVYLLNGGGSAGKSSLAKALQEQAEDIMLHVSVDDIVRLFRHD
jgi:chloramphenicol 3-O-phosphotransferase